MVVGVSLSNVINWNEGGDAVIVIPKIVLADAGTTERQRSRKKTAARVFILVRPLRLGPGSFYRTAAAGTSLFSCKPATGMMISIVEMSGANGHGEVRHVDEYLAIGQKAGASDIHLGVNAPPIWRLHGILQPIWPDAAKLTSEQTTALAEGFLTEAQTIQLNQRGDADFAYANEFGRFRTSVVRQRLGIDLVFRIINTKVRTMDELGLPEHLKLLTRYQNGLIL